MAAALGSGLPVHEAVGTMVVDIGGGDGNRDHKLERRSNIRQRTRQWGSF